MPTDEVNLHPYYYKLKANFRLVVDRLVAHQLIDADNGWLARFDDNPHTAIPALQRVLNDMYEGERFSKVDEGRIHLMENNLANAYAEYVGARQINLKPQPHIHVVIAISRSVEPLKVHNGSVVSSAQVETKRYDVRNMNIGEVFIKFLRDYDISNCRVNFHPGEQSAYETDTIVAHFDGIDHSGPEHKLRQRDPVNLTAYGCYCTGEFDNDGVAPF